MISEFPDALGVSPAQAPDGIWLPRCIVCGGKRFIPVYPAAFCWLMQCARCHLRLSQPQAGDESLARVYDRDYYRTFGYEPARAGRYRTMKQASFAALLRVAERWFAPGRLLDVGSALGDLLVAAKRRGWAPCGVEPNPFAVRWAEEVAPGGTFTGSLEEMAPEPGSFDLVTCLDVIEHLRRPDVTLRQMREALRDRGGLMIATNDVRSTASRLMGPRWVHYHIDHLWYFSRQTLGALVTGAGFEVLAVLPARKIFNLNYVLGILAHSPNHRLLQQAAQTALRLLPDAPLRTLWPPVREGLLLLAQRR